MGKIAEQLKLAFVPDEQNQFQPPALRERSLLFYAFGLVILKFVILILVFYLPQTDFFAAINSRFLVDLINQERTARDLTPLTLNEKLNQAAYLKAQDMIANDYFDHTSPSGVSPWYWFGKAGYQFNWAGENLAMHFFETETVFEAWMNSPSHRDNILSPNFKEIGVAVASGEIQGRETTVSVLTFGSTKVSQIAEPQVSLSTPASLTEPKQKEEQPSVEPTPKSEPEIEVPTTATELGQSGQETIAELLPATNLVQVPNLELSKPKRILGAVTFNFMELTSNLYLYFSIFLIVALAINILVKIRIQHVPTIVLTLILIGISVGMIFV